MCRLGSHRLSGRTEKISDYLHHADRRECRTETGKGTKLTSRLITDDTCSIKSGILKIISEVTPFCFSWPFTYHEAKRKGTGQAQNRTRERRPRHRYIFGKKTAQDRSAKATKEPRVNESKGETPAKGFSDQCRSGRRPNIGCAKLAGSGPGSRGIGSITKPEEGQGK